MTRSLFLILLSVMSVRSVQDPYQKGWRIIHGREIKRNNRYPFLAIFNIDPSLSRKGKISCTASLISSSWLLSAAHCLGDKAQLKPGLCRRKAYLELCRINKIKDLVIVPKESHIFFDVHNFGQEHKIRKPSLIKYIIMPRIAYRATGLAGFGGYDMTLIRLRVPVDKNVPTACLPHPVLFGDINTSIAAGYGKFKRTTCETNAIGPDKFFYCGLETDCTPDNPKFGRAECGVQWPDLDGFDIHGCSYDSTPSSKSLLCQAFHNKTYFEFGDEVDEVVLVSSKTSKPVDKCYRTAAGMNGWCGTNQFPGHALALQTFDMGTSHGWGFCSDSCHIDPSAPMTGVERHAQVDVLDEAYCTRKLFENRPKPFTVMPHVLCVARNFTYKTAIFEFNGRNFYQMNQRPDDQFKYLGRKQTWYLASSPACHGDSGGPLLQAHPSLLGRHVITGITSQGQSDRRHCGGNGGHTHYVRVKKFVGYIAQYVHEEEMCFSHTLQQPAIKFLNREFFKFSKKQMVKNNILKRKLRQPFRVKMIMKRKNGRRLMG